MVDWQRMQDIFLEARTLTGDALEGLLRDRCAGDAELLAEVRSLLLADREQGPLDAPLPLLHTASDPYDAKLPDRIGPYLLMGEVGRGGMAVVARAHDRRLLREVALKVISGGSRPNRERDRFIAEARAAARLDHPNICTIYDIGVLEDGRLYMAMPYYRRGTLADKLRAGPMTLTDTVEVGLAVTGALAAAHAAGIVHRDVKPANIAFGEDGEAKLLDFGIAQLGGYDSLDEGHTPGTPAYMAPEQIQGERVDGRGDLWALGVVMFEMLTGRRPASFADGVSPGRSDRVAPSRELETLRREVPRPLVDVIERALRRDPAERFQSAQEMRAALRTCTVGAGQRAGLGRLGGRAAAVIGVTALTAVSALIWLRGRPVPASPDGTDPGMVAVLPFRVSADSTLSYLREGMVDLLAAKLTGEGRLRAADPRLVQRVIGTPEDGPMEEATPEAALEAARRLGAGRALVGEVVGTPTGLVINASVLDQRGATVGRGNVVGPHEELPELVDGLVAQLLSTTAGEHPQRLAGLTSTSLPALRAFLEGQADYRQGRYEESVLHYTHALEYDSTFALAGLGLALAAGWTSGSAYARERGEAVAWAFRGELSARDRALLLALVGPNYPRTSSVRDMMAAVEEALLGYPDRAELWYELGDLHFHYGRAVGRSDWETRAEGALARALLLDSAFAPASHHLVALYARAGDDSALVHTADAYLAGNPLGATADYIRWRTAAAVSELGTDVPDGDRLEGLDAETLGWIVMNTQDDGFAMDHGLRAASLLVTRPGTSLEEFDRRMGLFASLLNAGRSSDALRALGGLRDVAPDPTFGQRLRVLTALYADGDSIAADSAATELARSANLAALDRCVLDLWLRRINTSAALGSFRERDDPSGSVTSSGGVWRVICDAVRAAELEARTAGSTGQALRALDSLLLSGPSHGPMSDGHTDYARVALGRLLEALGDRAGALRALRRRYYFIGWQPYLAASLHDELRLAIATGDTLGAREAAAHILTLRSDPEPALRDDVERARRFLANTAAPRRR